MPCHHDGSRRFGSGTWPTRIGAPSAINACRADRCANFLDRLDRAEIGQMHSIRRSHRKCIGRLLVPSLRFWGGRSPSTITAHSAEGLFPSPPSRRRRRLVDLADHHRLAVVDPQPCCAAHLVDGVWLNNSVVSCSSTSSLMRFSHFCWNMKSPTESASAPPGCRGSWPWRWRRRCAPPCRRVVLQQHVHEFAPRRESMIESVLVDELLAAVEARRSDYTFAAGGLHVNRAQLDQGNGPIRCARRPQ